MVDQEVVAETKQITFLDPCNQLTPPTSCFKFEGEAIANPYDRGYSAINNCHGGWCQSIFETLFVCKCIKEKRKILFNET